MSDIHPGTPRDDVDRPNLTVEDAGTTTDPADLVGEERARQGDEPFTTDTAGSDEAEPADTAPADTVPARAEASSPADDRAEGLAALAGDDSIGHVFDQTNGVIDGLDGDSDGTAESDGFSASERGDDNPDLFHEGIVDAGDGGSDDTRRTGN